MKKIFLSMSLIALMAAPAMAANGGEKKKAKTEPKVECKKDNCDPKVCDPKNCDPKCCDFMACPKEEKCMPESTPKTAK